MISEQKVGGKELMINLTYDPSAEDETTLTMEALGGFPYVLVEIDPEKITDDKVEVTVRVAGEKIALSRWGQVLQILGEELQKVTDEQIEEAQG